MITPHKSTTEVNYLNSYTPQAYFHNISQWADPGFQAKIIMRFHCQPQSPWIFELIWVCARKVWDFGLIIIIHDLCLLYQCKVNLINSEKKTDKISVIAVRVV